MIIYEMRWQLAFLSTQVKFPHVAAMKNIQFDL